MGLEDVRERRSRTGRRGGSGRSVAPTSTPSDPNPFVTGAPTSGGMSEWLEEQRRKEAEEEAAKDKGPKTAAEKYGDPLAWADYVDDRIRGDMENFAEAYGIDERMLIGWYEANAGGMFEYIEQQALTGRGASANAFGGTPGDSQLEMHSLYEIAKNWLNIRSPELKKMYTGDFGPRVSGGGSGSRGRGSRGPSAADIRAQFDLDALTENVNQMYRAYLLQEAPGARKIASAYVEAIVRNPEQKLDFQQFVLNRIRGEARHKSIYRNKPESVDELDYLGPYVQAARSVMRPQNADEAAVGGAMFGADAQSFQARLERSDEVTGSAPFINSMQARVSDISKVLRG